MAGSVFEIKTVKTSIALILVASSLLLTGCYSTHHHSHGREARHGGGCCCCCCCCAKGQAVRPGVPMGRPMPIPGMPGRIERFTPPKEQDLKSVPPWFSNQPAAPDSIEGKLRREDKAWVRSGGEIKEGMFVQDILEGRLNQPVGRGAIGKVVSVDKPENGQPTAMVDFGQGYKVPIYFHELSPIRILGEDKPAKKHR